MFFSSFMGESLYKNGERAIGFGVMLIEKGLILNTIFVMKRIKLVENRLF